MNLKVGMVSLGCDKNRVDAEVMLSDLKKYGFTIVSDEKSADVIIVNTCGFIESAKTESIETIIEMSKNKDGSCKALIVTGCMAERYKEELINEMPEIDAIVGTGSYSQLAETINSVIKNKNKIVKTGNLNYNLDYQQRILTTPSHYAYIKIAEGCNNNCSYCIIPKLRGNFRSKKIEDILREAHDLVNGGVKEIILVAQDTTRYGVDLYGKRSLSHLIDELQKIDGIKWIRILYTYPDEMDIELINSIKNNKKVVHYFDIPIQHVNNNILKRMKRSTSKENIVNIIDMIRNEISDAIIRTSIIVGFPGETDEEFEELKDFLKQYKLDRVGIFSYSQEEDTLAAQMPNQIEEDIKELRKNELMEIQQQIALTKNIQLIGKDISTMIEGKVKDGKYYGRTYGDSPEIDQQIFIKTKTNLGKGDIINVRVVKAYNYDLLGEISDESSK